MSNPECPLELFLADIYELGEYAGHSISDLGDSDRDRSWCYGHEAYQEWEALRAEARPHIDAILALLRAAGRDAVKPPLSA